MKKLIATMVVLVILVVGMTVTARGETKMRYAWWEKTGSPIDGVYEIHYYAKVELGNSGETIDIEIDKDTYEKIEADRDIDEERYNNKFTTKAKKWVIGATQTVKGWF